MAGNIPDFTGKYILNSEKSESIEPLLELMEFNWMMRKLAAAARPSIEMRHTHPQLTIVTINPIRSKTESMVVDGPTEMREHDMAGMAAHSVISGENQTIVARVKGDKMEISQVFSLLPGGGLQMIMTAIKDKKTLVIKRVFDVVVG